ncbi:maltose alpha-D-glucosyltransferase [soil metagenome]
MALPRNPQWFKSAIFYEVLTRGFSDANNDGTGDIRGLTQKLDYLEWLGIDCIWLLPFYDSPLRDGGYDISDFYAVLADFGDVDDVSELLEQAHARGIRVIADMVINHTSDQHPWFQESRHPGSDKREWYVWSDTDEKYEDARIIFVDTEISNWTWDPEAGAYYWHRFFSHQPDLNFDHPDVQEAMLDVVRYWLRIGFDGLRLDAVPYLFEREGTNGENLPETHEYLARLRKMVDDEFEDRVLLAEANQWPEDVVDYFGTEEAPECHMAFHFPVMPRLFMSVRREESKPIVEVMDNTPAIPDNAQWGIFLRNHDELTLEMVTDEERDYMYAEYARDARMRANVGIRRRLAPLLENSRNQIQLFHALLLSLPGSPVMYYCDEIGMGDNIFLGDRDGVRTPMQWSIDRNAGFSRAEFAELYLPPIMDQVFSYQALNVETQQRDPNSQLHWVRWLLHVRRRHAVFGAGDFEALRPSNPRVLAFLRSTPDDTVLVVANLSDNAQYVELDLSRFAGDHLVELLGGTRFPTVGELPYLLTLGSHGFYWFQIAPEPHGQRDDSR